MAKEQPRCCNSSIVQCYESRFAEAVTQPPRLSLKKLMDSSRGQNLRALLGHFWPLPAASASALADASRCARLCRDTAIRDIGGMSGVIVLSAFATA
jgi:hypothetical protein